MENTRETLISSIHGEQSGNTREWEVPGIREKLWGYHCSLLGLCLGKPCANYGATLPVTDSVQKLAASQNISHESWGCLPRGNCHPYLLSAALLDVSGLGLGHHPELCELCGLYRAHGVLRLPSPMVLEKHHCNVVAFREQRYSLPQLLRIVPWRSSPPLFVNKKRPFESLANRKENDPVSSTWLAREGSLGGCS